MDCTFLNAAGQTLFARGDMESGHYVHQEMNMTADFPYDPGKVIERGQRIAFHDPATGLLQVFEIRSVVNTEPDHYQQITAEHIAISELQDEHINKTEITDKTALQALTTVLTGTLWSPGNSDTSVTQSADISRGSVWNAVCTIQQNWNVYIIPRIVFTNGVITGRYLDVFRAQPISSGIRLSIRKNLYDPAVTYNDEDVLTALYGYGGSVQFPQTGGDDTTQELTFADEVWEATSKHPAKPSGQTYLEWPEKTALYGRNGRPRFGYYQNGSIKDAGVLLEKTWESLQQTADPKICIDGTVADLHRLGYNDEPLRLHYAAIVEIEETGEAFRKEITQFDEDLIDPTGSRIGIGDYIPNIVYINRETNDRASGGGGGGGGRGMTNLEDEDAKTFTEFIRTQNQIGMVVGTVDGENYIRGGQIVLAINDDGGTTALIEADCIDISGVVVSINATEGLIINADHIDINGLITDLASESITVVALTCNTLEADGDGTSISSYGDIDCGGDIGAAGNIGCNGNMSCVQMGCNSIVVSQNGTSSLQAASCTSLTVPDGSLTVGSYAASWKSYSARHCTLSTSRYFMYAASSGSTDPTGTTTGRVVTDYTDTTIYYLGRTAT